MKSFIQFLFFVSLYNNIWQFWIPFLSFVNALRLICIMIIIFLWKICRLNTPQVGALFNIEFLTWCVILLQPSLFIMRIINIFIIIVWICNCIQFSQLLVSISDWSVKDILRFKMLWLVFKRMLGTYIDFIFWMGYC